MASNEEKPLNPLPQHDPPLYEVGGVKRFTVSWMQWLFELRDKVNVINALLINFSNLTGTGFPSLSGGQFNIRTLTAGIGIAIQNGDGAAGNPIIATRAQFITTKTDFPAPVAGVVSLPNNTTYFLLNQVDMLGDRFNCGTNIAILGGTADSCGLISTGLAGGSPLFISTSSLDLRFINLSAPTGRLFDLNDGVGSSLGWLGIRIFDTPTLGTLQNYANIVVNESIITNSANLTLDGTIASFVSETSLWDGRTGQTTITVPATATFTRRFRMLYTALTVLPGETGINFSASATIPDEQYILDNVNFSGGGTYLAGLTYTSNKAAFFKCTGINNTNAIAQYSMTGNATATVIAVAGTFVKMAGTTVAGALNQKFNTAVTNRAVYTGAFTADFNVTVFASMRSGNNQSLRMRIAKNGVTIADSNMVFLTTGSGDASAIGTQTLSNLVPTDFLEIFVTNDTAANNITVSDLNVIIRRLN